MTQKTFFFSRVRDLEPELGVEATEELWWESSRNYYIYLNLYYVGTDTGWLGNNCILWNNSWIFPVDLRAYILCESEVSAYILNSYLFRKYALIFDSLSNLYNVHWNTFCAQERMYVNQKAAAFTEYCYEISVFLPRISVMDCSYLPITLVFLSHFFLLIFLIEYLSLYWYKWPFCSNNLVTKLI